MRPIVGLVIVLLWPPMSRSDEPFQSLSYTEALAKAKANGRLVFIDFATDWCAPCKKLDATTFKDPEVRTWLAAKTVAIKVDGDREEKLVATLKVKAYPTLLLVRPDGREVDRLVGYRDAKQFLSEVNDVLAGRDAVTRAKEKVLKNDKDPITRMELARVYAQRGRYDDALVEYLWCYDVGAVHSPAFVGVRSSFLLNELLQLAEEHPGAREALVMRRERLESLVLAKEPTPTFAQVSELVSLSQALGRTDSLLKVFDRLGGEDAPGRALRQPVFAAVLAELAKAKRYADILAEVEDPLRAFDEAVKNHQLAERHLKASLAKLPEEVRQLALDGQAKQLIEPFGFYYAALLAQARKDDAARLADRILSFHPHAVAFNLLIAQARQVGQDEIAERLVERARRSILATPPPPPRDPPGKEPMEDEVS